jgi:serine kinase of HPr protein (carbohydrate metabolism regulator)
MILVHGTCVDVAGVGVLLRGPPASGKSDLALRLIDGGARLIADDQVELEAEGGVLKATAPTTIAGLLEVRGVGVVRVPWQTEGCLDLVVDLVPSADVERLPASDTCCYEGVELGLVALAAFEASSCAKVRLAARATRQDIRTEP